MWIVFVGWDGGVCCLYPIRLEPIFFFVFVENDRGIMRETDKRARDMNTTSQIHRQSIDTKKGQHYTLMYVMLLQLLQLNKHACLDSIHSSDVVCLSFFFFPLPTQTPFLLSQLTWA